MRALSELTSRAISHSQSVQSDMGRGDLLPKDFCDVLRAKRASQAVLGQPFPRDLKLVEVVPEIVATARQDLVREELDARNLLSSGKCAGSFVEMNFAHIGPAPIQNEAVLHQVLRDGKETGADPRPNLTTLKNTQSPSPCQRLEELHLVLARSHDRRPQRGRLSRMFKGMSQRMQVDVSILGVHERDSDTAGFNVLHSPTLCHASGLAQEEPI